VENRPLDRGAKTATSGLFFLVTGCVAFFWSQNYAIGTATQMGPGYFPALIGVLLSVLGAAMVVIGLRSGLHRIPLTWSEIEGVVLIVASIVTFGFLIDRVGLIVAIFVSMAIACARRVLSHPLEVFLTYCALTAFCALIFIYFFDMPIPLFHGPSGLW
jgi:hypothetical protein